MKLKVKCDFCGEPIKDVKKHLGRNKHFFCSRDCYKQFKIKKQEVECDWCGNIFLKKGSDIKRSKHNYCSQECSRSFVRWTGKTNRSPKVNGVEIHRAIMEDFIGRDLHSDEEVHHIDFNHSNNKINNLVILSKSKHAAIHARRKERDVHGKFIKKKQDV